MTFHKIHIILFCLAFIGNVNSQTLIEPESLEVIKSFEAKLENAELIEVRPNLPKIVPIKKVYQYQVSIVPIELAYPAPIIKPLAMTETNYFEKDNYYLKLGYGNLNNPNGRLRLSFYDGDRYKINTSLGYYALDNSKNIDFQKVAKYDLGLKGFARLNENVVFNFEGGFERDVRSFYDTREYPKSNYGKDRTIDGLHGKIGIGNIDKINSNISYDLSTIYKIDRIKSDAFSTGVGVALKAEKRASDKINIVMPITGMAYASDINDAENSLLVFEFAPHMHFQTGRFMAEVGAEIYHDDQIKTSVWPKVKLAYGIVKNYVQLIAGTEQNHRVNDLGHLMDYNPYAEVSKFDLRSTLWQEYSGGIRGELNFLSYQAEIGYKESKNELLITNDIVSGIITENIIYDEMNTSFLRGSINFALSDEISLGGSATKNIYNPKVENRAWGLPTLELNSYLNWKMFNEKLHWNSNLILADKNYTLGLSNDVNPTLEEISLNNLVELDTELEFWIAKQFSIYVYGHNLLNNKYQRWHGYPMVGINGGGGIQVKF